ncbi:MAG: bifunctional hydroxymethylpyrimidine kinase/phosphomethylpyrimidine kinase, partial [Chlamydiae bacterium]|nr:bifunctional hydroxymethylpyrimidine kinase/phosphomethylpyrimidine kinase [Chlamydiota bacterium]
DEAGRTFLQALADENVDTRGIIVDSKFVTPKKNRMMAAGQQIVRIDYESIQPLSDALLEEVRIQLPHLLQGVDIIAVSDYAKGFLSPLLLQDLMNAELPVVVDPKGIDFSRYRGATLLKPNLSEAIAAAGLGAEATLEEIAGVLLSEVQNVMITRSEEGISLFSEKRGQRDFPAQVRDVRDVTGAGDTVLAVVTAALANGVSLDESAALGNLAAAIAIEELGCARITSQQLKESVSAHV